MKQIVLVGTSHIAKESVVHIKNAVESYHPQVIAVELDRARVHSLYHKGEKPSKMSVLRKLGVGGFLFYLIGSVVQGQLGKIVQMEPGSDMKTAINMAQEKKIKTALIDRSIQITLQRFSKYFRKRELFIMLWDMLFPWRYKHLAFDIKTVPTQQQIKNIRNHLQKRYPSLFHIIVDERDQHMAKALLHLASVHEGTIIGVVGAAHVPGIEHYLQLFEQPVDGKGI